MPYGTEKVRHAYKSKHNLKRENQVILLMITDGEKWHYLTVKKLSEKDNKILKYNFGDKSMKAPFIIYADIEPLLEKMSTCHNNPEKSATTKINKHTPSGYSLFIQCSFDKTKNRFDYISIKDKKLIFRYFECEKNYEKDFNKKLIKRFSNTYKFCNGHINKFILLLKKGVYPYEYIDSWERFDETSLPDKEFFYSNLNMEDILDVDYRHAERVFKNLNNKNLGEYHDLYVQGDTLLLADVFENFRKTCLKV